MLKYFYYVALYKGFTNASKELNIVQSALSYNVKKLEEMMDKVLIIRSSKKFELTDEGTELFDTLKSVFGILENNFEPFQNNIYDEITIGIRHYLSDFALKNAVEIFLTEHPNVHITINLYSKLDTDKFEEEYDLLIDYQEYTELIETNYKEDIFQLKNVIVCGKELYNKYKNVSSIKDLKNENFISVCPSRKKGKINKICFENNMLFKDVISINDSLLSKKLISENFGIGIVNEESISKELNDGTIKKINIQEKLFDDKIVAVYKNNKKINLSKKFITILLKEYNEEEF